MTDNVNDIFAQVREKLHIVKGPLDDGRYIAWCPYHSDGQGKPPHNPNFYISQWGFICHACGEKGSLQKLANYLGIISPREASVSGQDQDIVVTYDCRDEDGNLLFQVVRTNDKRFWQRRPDGEGNWINNLDGVRRVLYRLPEICSRPDDLVFVVEGEKDVERLEKEGLLGTTNAGGAGKWRSEYSESLQGRDVAVLFDNDKPGRAHADQVVASLLGTARSVKLVELPDLAPKGDASDWLAAGHTKKELLALVESTAAIDEPRASQERKKSSQRKSQAERLVDLVIQSQVELFHDERGEPYAAMRTPEGRSICSLNSRQFRDWLSRLGWMAMSKALIANVITEVVGVLSGMAKFDGQKYTLRVRCARHEGAIWYDLDGHRAIRIYPGGWDVVTNPPILFRSFQHQQPLPEPARGGNLRKILEFVNLKDAHARLLLECFIVAAMVPDIPIPALTVHGVQGSAKTTLLKVIKMLLDSSSVCVRGGVRDPAEFAQAAFQNRLLLFDNLTSLPQWLSDALCRTVTGEGYSKRTLYTDEDTTVFEYQRIVGLSGINLVAQSPDLLDRSIILMLEPISSDERREEHVFWRDYQQALPGILGGVFDTLAKAMTLVDDLELNQLPRMADFARWGASAAIALGYTADNFLAGYQNNVCEQNQAAIDASLVAQTILIFMENQDTWEGTPGRLLGDLNTVAENGNIDIRARAWPKNPSWLTRRLREVFPNLLAMGIRVNSDDRTPGHRVIRLEKI